MAKHFVFEQMVWERRAIYWDEWKVAPRPKLMNRTRAKLLTGSCLARYKYRPIASRYTRDLRDHFHKLRIPPDQLLETQLLNKSVVHSFCITLAATRDPGDAMTQFSGANRCNDESSATSTASRIRSSLPFSGRIASVGVANGFFRSHRKNLMAAGSGVVATGTMRSALHLCSVSGANDVHCARSRLTSAVVKEGSHAQPSETLGFWSMMSSRRGAVMNITVVRGWEATAGSCSGQADRTLFPPFGSVNRLTNSSRRGVNKSAFPGYQRYCCARTIRATTYTKARECRFNRLQFRHRRTLRLNSWLDR